MRRALIPTSAFTRACRRVFKKNPSIGGSVERCLERMARDVYDPTLRTHKLKGALESSWSSSAGYDLRIVFSFLKHEGREAILLESMGTHDAVY